MNFREIVEIVDNNIHLKDEVTEAHITSSDDIINNVLAAVFHQKHKPAPKDFDCKEYKLSALYIGSKLYDVLKNEFNLKDNFQIFEVSAYKDETVHPYMINYHHT